MSDQEKTDTTRCCVVVNHEQQYAIWPAGKALPLGWSSVDKEGTKTECLDYIEKTWTDMRPLSLRRQLSGPE